MEIDNEERRRANNGLFETGTGDLSIALN